MLRVLPSRGTPILSPAKRPLTSHAVRERRLRARPRSRALRSQPEHAPEAIAPLEHDAVVQRVG